MSRAGDAHVVWEAKRRAVRLQDANHSVERDAFVFRQLVPPRFEFIRYLNRPRHRGSMSSTEYAVNGIIPDESRTYFSHKSSTRKRSTSKSGDVLCARRAPNRESPSVRDRGMAGDRR